jgi:hypothetical protein
MMSRRCFADIKGGCYWYAITSVVVRYTLYQLCTNGCEEILRVSSKMSYEKYTDRIIVCVNSELESIRVYSGIWVPGTHSGTDHLIMGIGLWSINERIRV